MRASKISFVLELLRRNYIVLELLFLAIDVRQGGGGTSFFETQNRSKYSRQRLGSLSAFVISVARLIQSYTGLRNMVGRIVFLKVIWVTI